jgi:hypothetical protein
MAKYRKASEKTVARGKGISTDKLSLKEAKDYFNERAKETGAKRFRHNGQVYDLAGNKITESAPARSSGGGSSAAPGSSRPKARPTTSSGGAQADQRTSGAPPSRPAKAAAKRGEVNPVAVGVGAAGAVAAGIAAVRSGRSGPTTGTSKPSVSDRVRAAGAKPKPAAKSSTGGPARTPVAKPAKPVAAPSKAKPGAKLRGGGGRAVGNNPGSMIGRTGAGPLAELPEILKLKDM